MANVEHGRRGSVSLAEVLALAYVFRVAPVDLFLPVGRADWVEILPGMRVHPHRAYKWVIGTEPPPAGADGTMSTGVAEWHASTQALHMYQELQELMDAIREAEREIRRAEFVGDADDARQWREHLVSALRNLARHLDAMTEADVRAPGLPSEWVEPMTSLDMLKHPDAVRIYDVKLPADG